MADTIAGYLVIPAIVAVFLYFALTGEDADACWVFTSGPDAGYCADEYLVTFDDPGAAIDRMEAAGKIRYVDP